MRMWLGALAASALVVALPAGAADPLSAHAVEAMRSLTDRMLQQWSPDCATPGANQVQTDMRFTISPNGQVIQGPDWMNQRNDPVWRAGAERAKGAILKGQPYSGLAPEIYGRPIVITFDARTACGT